MKYIVIILCIAVILTGCREQVEYNDEEITAEYVNRLKLKGNVKISYVFDKTVLEFENNYSDYFYYNEKIYFLCGDTLVSYDNYGEIMDIIDLPENTVDIAMENDGNTLVYDGNDIIRNNEVIYSVILESSEEFVDIYTDKLGRIYYFTSESVVGMYRDGNIIFDMKINGTLIEVCQMLSGEILLHIDDRYVYLDVNNHKLDREIPIPKVPYDYETIMGNGFELYLLSADMNLYGYSIMEKEPIKVMDLINSGINIFDISNFKIITSELMLYETTDGDTVLLNKSDVNDTQSKLPIKIASYGYDEKLIDLIIDFNTFSKIYHINLIDYSIYNLDDDIETGNIPDVFISDENLNLGKYILNEMFIDLNLMNDKINLIDSIFKAFNYEGKLYQLPSEFKIHSFAGKTEMVGSELYWAMNTFNNLFPDVESSSRLISNITYMNMLYLLTTAELQNYLFRSPDGFKDEGYKNLLSISMHIGSEIYRKGNYNGNNDEYISGKTMIYYFSMNQPDDYNILYDVFGTDKISLKGIPAYGGNIGVVMESIKTYSMSKHCEAIDGAWEFIKILMHEYYDDEYLSAVEEIFDDQINISSLSENEKIYIADIIKDKNPANIFPMNNEIFDMIDAEVIKLHAGGGSINNIANAIDMKISRFIKNYIH